MGGFAIGTTEFATMSLLPFMAKGLDIDEPTAGHVISAYALGVVVGAPLIAALGARMSRQRLLLLLMGAFALANALSGMAPSYGWMLVFRFLSGLPHGAYFGVAALVAASLVPFEQRTQAVGRVMLGLTTATIVGVPLANWLGQALGWRSGFALVACVAIATVLMIWWIVPRQPGDANASPRRELSALRSEQVWLTLGVGAIGFGGMFAVYTYLSSTLIEVTGVSPQVVPIVLAVFGVGTTLGNLVVPRFADRALMPTAGALLLGSAAALAFYAVATESLWTICLAVFAVGIGGALGTVLQTRLMDVAGDAQTLAAALNHSAFNAANALGPWAAGLAISAGYGWASSGWVGCALALGGFAIWMVAVWRAREPVIVLKPVLAAPTPLESSC
jgi:DHA1 family inner membrane transport protein